MSAWRHAFFEVPQNPTNYSGFNRSFGYYNDRILIKRELSENNSKRQGISGLSSANLDSVDSHDFIYVTFQEPLQRFYYYGGTKVDKQGKKKNIPLEFNWRALFNPLRVLDLIEEIWNCGCDALGTLFAISKDGKVRRPWYAIFPQTLSFILRLPVVFIQTNRNIFFHPYDTLVKRYVTSLNQLFPENGKKLDHGEKVKIGFSIFMQTVKLGMIALLFAAASGAAFVQPVVNIANLVTGTLMSIPGISQIFITPFLVAGQYVFSPMLSSILSPFISGESLNVAITVLTGPTALFASMCMVIPDKFADTSNSVIGYTTERTMRKSWYDSFMEGCGREDADKVHKASLSKTQNSLGAPSPSNSPTVASSAPGGSRQSGLILGQPA